jgi:hypothetical protein
MTARRVSKRRKSKRVSRQRNSKGVTKRVRKLYGGADDNDSVIGTVCIQVSKRKSAGIGPEVRIHQFNRLESKRLNQIAKEQRQRLRLANRISLAENRESVQPFTEAQLLYQRMQARR